YFTVIFKNQSDEEAKLVVEAGEQDRLGEDGQPVKGADGGNLKEPIEYCTDLVRPDTQAALTLSFIDPGRYEFHAQDEAGESLAAG
ncbi:hypothetical protein, partial [Bordetella trematum]|uniref:hypothetical protein n=1 Tax=Bordetella trematum TaxID=123899 RepID=UPI003988D767